MQLSLIIQNIKDEMIRENFYRLLAWIGLQPVLNCDFKFFEADIPAAAATYTLAHGLPFIPKDVVLLSATGDQNYFFRYQEFDDVNIYLTIGGPVRLRFLLGNYPRSSSAVDFPYVALDTGAGVTPLESFQSDTAWDGVITTLDVNVSASITDARKCVWELCDNSNNYERIWCSIKATSASNVRIAMTPAPAAGSYRLVGVSTT